MSSRASTAIADVIALIAIDQPDPISTMSTPEIAGPMRPPRWKIAPLRLIALRSRAVPTISPTNADRDGSSMAIEAPVSAATRRTCQTSTQPSSTRAASAPFATVPIDWQTISTRCLRERSEITPAHGPSSRVGANCSATVMPTRATLPVSSSTSQSTAIRAIQPPVFANSCETT